VIRAPRCLRACALVVALIATLSGCGGQSSAQPSAASATEKVVNVYNWSDYIQPSVIADFEKEYGIRVNYDVFDSNEILETKLLTGHTNYDIVAPSGAFLERQIKADIYQKLDKSQLPNLANVDPEVARATALYDPGNQYAVDYMWITSGVGYNKAAIRERLADAPVDSWRILFDPALAAKFRDCGIGILDAPSEVLATVLDTGELACRHRRSFAGGLTFTAREHQSELERQRARRRQRQEVEVEVRPLSRYDELIPA